MSLTELNEPTFYWRSPPDLSLSPILTAALDAFYDDGYHGTSVRGIAKRVGVTVPALYYHHTNKEAILFSLLESSINHLQRHVRAALEDAGDDVVDRFVFLVECVIRFTSSSEKINYIDHEIKSLSPNPRAQYANKRDQIERWTTEVIVAGQEAGYFDVASPRDTARALLGMIQAITTWFRPDGELTIDELTARYVDICCHTVGAAPEVLARAQESVKRVAD